MQNKKIPCGGGLRSNTVKLNWNFPEGGCKTKKILWGSMDIFWNCTKWTYKETPSPCPIFIDIVMLRGCKPCWVRCGSGGGGGLPYNSKMFDD